MFNSFYGGFLGNIAGNPFGSDFVVPQQRRPVPGGPQMAPLKQPPARVFPPDQPGREGAIDVRLAMGMPGMNVGNMGGMSAAMDPHPLGQATRARSTKLNVCMTNQEAFSQWAVMQASAKKQVLTGRPFLDLLI
jgi:hypothetical protein